MPKHRSTVYTVVREIKDGYGSDWQFSGVVGVYLTPERADEVAGACRQEVKDKLMAYHDRYSFTVHASTWYDE